MKNAQVTMSNETMKQLDMLAQRSNKTIEEITSEMLERGVKDACYRMRRNAQKWQETKALKERMTELEQLLEGKGE
jgi:predicted DNA-binding protein